MELRPGMYFELDGKGLTYVGTQANSEQAEKPNIVARVTSDSDSEALHTVVPFDDVFSRGENFSLFGEQLTHKELQKQYDDQVRVLKETGILEEISPNVLGIKDTEENKYPLPSFDDIEDHIYQRQERYREKVGQGFKRLLLVPFAVPLSSLIVPYQRSLVRVFQEGKLVIQDGDQQVPITELNMQEPIYIYDYDPGAGRELWYYPTSFSNTSGFPGMKKQDYLSLDSAFGWNILLIEDYPQLPLDNKRPTVHGRTMLPEMDGSEALRQQITDPQYSHEIPWTPEDWLTYALYNLELRSCVTDSDYIYPGTFIMLPVGDLLGAYIPPSVARRVLNPKFIGWESITKKAYLGMSAAENLRKRARTAVAIE